jgi:hypothetical protein
VGQKKTIFLEKIEFFRKCVRFLKIFCFSFLFIFQLDGFRSTPLGYEIELLLGKEEYDPIIGPGLMHTLTSTSPVLAI